MLSIARTDGCLSSRVDKGFYRVSIDLYVDIEHGDSSKRFWIMFHSSLHIGCYILESDGLLDLCLGFHIKRICVEVLLKKETLKVRYNEFRFGLTRPAMQTDGEKKSTICCKRAISALLL